MRSLFFREPSRRAAAAEHSWAWAWYREWSEIARTVIQRGDVLIRMGLRSPSRRSAAEDEDESLPEPDRPID